MESNQRKGKSSKTSFEPEVEKVAELMNKAMMIPPEMLPVKAKGKDKLEHVIEKHT